MISAVKRFLEKSVPFLLPPIRAMGSVIKHQSSRLRIRRLLNERRELFVEVGAGDKKGENGWLTIDLTKNCDVFWDLRRGLPFPDDRVSKIYSSHFFEHLSYKQGQKFLDECKRVLKPGGTFSICVPNARIYLEAYVKAVPLDVNEFFRYRPAYNDTTKIDYVNYTAYLDDHHRYMFDEENLLFILTSKGFRNVRLRDFDATLDLQKRHFESIYAEAEK